MTDDNRNQQEGTPSADPGAGQEPDGIIIDIPEGMKDMTAQELAEYAREHPEEWHSAVNSLKTSSHRMGDMLAQSIGRALDAELKAGMADIARDRMTESLGNAARGAAEYLGSADFRTAAQLAAQLESMNFKITEQLGKMDFGIKAEILARRIGEIEAGLSQIIQAVATANQFVTLSDDIDAAALDALCKECEELKPYITAELEKRKEELDEMTVEDFMYWLPAIAPRKADKDGSQAEAGTQEKTRGQQLVDGAKAEILAILNAARAARDAAEAEAEAAQKLNLPAVTYTKKPGIELTTDKLMTVFFGANAPAPRGQIEGQMSFLPVKYEKTGAPEITLYYNYSFDDDVLKKLKLEKKIDDEDYFILSFIASFWRTGDRNISVSKLYRDMTGESPNSRQLTDITNRLIKLATTNIFLNDKDVRQGWGLLDGKEQKTYKTITAQLAPIVVGTERFVAGGNVVDAGIQILGEPVVMKLGYEIGQYTTVPKSLLHVKKKDGKRLNRTKRFYRVMHYLIRRIAAMKSDNLSHKILYDSFYAEIGETTTRGKQLARDCMYTILDYFKTCNNWINGYKEETTASTGKVGVRIFCNTTSKKKITNKKRKQQ